MKRSQLERYSVCSWRMVLQLASPSRESGTSLLWTRWAHARYWRGRSTGRSNNTFAHALKPQLAAHVSPWALSMPLVRPMSSICVVILRAFCVVNYSMLVVLQVFEEKTEREDQHIEYVLHSFFLMEIIWDHRLSYFKEDPAAVLQSTRCILVSNLRIC